MAFMDKLKGAAGKAAEAANNLTKKAGEEFNRLKEEGEKKKAEQEALDAENKAKAEAASEQMISDILGGYKAEQKNFYCDMTEDEIQRFAKEFYEKMVLPGSKASLSCILMFPHIAEKKVAFAKAIDESGLTTPILYIKDQDNQEFLITKDAFYFKTKMENAGKYSCTGKVDMKRINIFRMDFDESEGVFRVNDVSIAKIRICNTYRQDFCALNRYFESVLTRDFDISNEEIDQLIHEKIGDKIYQQVKKYMSYEDELVMYYAGGLDSLMATDYIACTTKQIIIVDREMLGVTANVKQFYYEDITSMATEQNSKSDDLFVAIIDSALTAALKMCNLQITVAGSKNQISTLYTVEAERVIAIYHQMRKEAKQGNQPVQTIIQQKEPDVLEQLEKLAKLKEAGILTEEEFQEKKAALLGKL